MLEGAEKNKREFVLGAGRGDTDFNTGIAILSQFAGEVFVQFGVEDTVSDKLARTRTKTLRIHFLHPSILMEDPSIGCVSRQ